MIDLCVFFIHPSPKIKFSLVDDFLPITKHVVSIMGSLSSPMQPPHVVVFPFMAQGHTIPLLDVSKELARRGLKVTIITTPSNAPFIVSKISPYPTISLSIISFPTIKELPQGCENVANLPSLHFFPTFIKVTKKMKQQFEQILEENIPICVISDMFLYWTQESCQILKIPRIVSHGMGALPMSILGDLKNVSNLDLDPIHLPNVSLPFQLDRIDLPDHLWDDDSDEGRNEFSNVIQELEQENCKSFGVLVNSFQELESAYVPSLLSSYQKETKAWLVGPLLLYDGPNVVREPGPYINWLDDQMGLVGPSSVIYVSFGSQARLSDEQADEIALGLEKAGEPFMWVIRSKTWVPPDGWEDRVEGRGLVVRDWVDQRSILVHPAIGGFLSHCGWNSVLEGLSMGLPILAWPMEAEQWLNAKYVTMGLKVGLTVQREFDEEKKIRTVHHDVICDGVKELLKGDEGKAAKERAQELGKMARQAVEKGASSSKQLDELINCLVVQQNQSNA